MDNNQAAYQAGLEAFNEGQLASSCTLPFKGELYNHWLTGYWSVIKHAAEDGKDIQFLCREKKDWVDIPQLEYVVSDPNTLYRVKPEPEGYIGIDLASDSDQTIYTIIDKPADRADFDALWATIKPKYEPVKDEFVYRLYQAATSAQAAEIARLRDAFKKTGKLLLESAAPYDEACEVVREINNER